MSTKIEWTDETWNPVMGCTPVSKGCENCYARAMIRRFAGRKGWPCDPDRVVMFAGRLNQPLHWTGHKRIFIPSMGDLFHPNVPFDFVDRVFATMGHSYWHTFQVLTKRSLRMHEYITTGQESDRFKPLVNVWLGASIEDQDTADDRIPHLLNTPAAVRFVSCEPLLGPIELGMRCLECGEYQHYSDLHNAEGECRNGGSECGYADRWQELDWVIVGGETGPGARPMHPDWARDIRDQCQEAGVPLFVKQLGSRYHPRGHRDLHGADMQFWPADLRIRQMPSGDR